MKNTIALALLFSASVFAQSPTVVSAPVDHLFVPKGFDNNDNVELIVKGSFPNPCYTRNKVDVKVVDDKIDVTITSLYSARISSLCEPLKVPFAEVVTIGSLQAGDYKVVVNSKLQEKLSVDVSSSQSIDDNIYAKVEYVDLGFTRGLAGDAMLITQSISKCLELDRVEYVGNEKDTYSVLPIMKKVSGNCSQENERREIPIKFDPHAFESDDVLLFVRSVDGKSVHAIVEK